MLIVPWLFNVPPATHRLLELIVPWLQRVPPLATVMSPEAVPVEVMQSVVPEVTMWLAELFEEIVIVHEVHCAADPLAKAKNATKKIAE